MKGKTATGLVTSLSHDGRGIAHVAGKTTFIDGVLIGEEVEFEYLKVKSKYDEAKVIKILSPSPNRQQPKCESFGICGGCSLQHMNSSLQLENKMAVLLEQLYHIGGITNVDVLSPTTTSSSFEYRRKARLGVRYVVKKEKLLIGFREKNGRFLADINACPVLNSSIGGNFELLRQLLLSLEGYTSIPQLEIAAGDDATAIIFRHLQPLSNEDLTKLLTFGRDNNFHIYLQPSGPASVTRLYPHEGPERLSYKIQAYNLEMLFHPTDFVQVNAEINNKLIGLAIELMAPTFKETFLDLFCGIGNFTLPLARYSKRVVGIEGDEQMVSRGYENAAHNQINNVDFKAQNLQEPHYTDRYMSEKFDGVLIDPPRTGALDVVQILPQLNIPKLVYISCNPATLARDAGYLTTNGYRMLKVGILDMFPQTSHVESIALFIKN